MNKNKLKELAGELDAAPRTGPEGSAEGARVITLSDELAKKMATDLRAAADAEGSYGMSARYAEQFGTGASNDDRDQATEFKSDTADPKKGTIDCVWYGGQPVARRDPDTGEPYMLTLDMAGCRMERLNSGAPVFDTHFSGDDFKSLVAGKVGTRAQVGVVQRAWPNGNKGMATLKFDLGDPD